MGWMFKSSCFNERKIQWEWFSLAGDFNWEWISADLQFVVDRSQVGWSVHCHSIKCGFRIQSLSYSHSVVMRIESTLYCEQKRRDWRVLGFPKIENSTIGERVRLFVYLTMMMMKLLLVGIADIATVFRRGYVVIRCSNIEVEECGKFWAQAAMR